MAWLLLTERSGLWAPASCSLKGPSCRELTVYMPGIHEGILERVQPRILHLSKPVVCERLGSYRIAKLMVRQGREEAESPACNTPLPT